MSNKEDAIVLTFGGIGCLLIVVLVVLWGVLLPTVGALYLLGYLGG